MRSRLLFVILLVILELFAFPTHPNVVHGSSPGLICLADPTSASTLADPCPAAPGLIFNGPMTNPFQQIRIGVYINGSAGLNGFDITLMTNHTLLRPAGVDLSGTVLLGTATVLVECLSGVLVKGSICLARDNLDTLHLAAISGRFGSTTVYPTTGLLFTALYNITGTSTGPVGLGFPIGCSGTSVAGGVCVTVSDGSLTPVSEAVHGGSFDNSSPPPYVTVAASSSSFGPEFPGASNTATITATAGTNYPGFATDAVTFTTIASPGLTATLSGANPCVTGGKGCTVSLVLSASVGGNFSVNILAQYSTVDLRNFNSSTLVAQATIRMIVTDFAISADPSSVSPVIAGVVGSSVVSVKSVNGFTGTVGLSASALDYECGLSPASVLVSGSAISVLSCSSSSAGNSVVTVTATSGLRSRTIQVSFSVQDFAVSVSSSSISLSAGSNETIFLTVLGLNGFGQRVRLSINPPSGLTVDPTALTFLPNGKVSLLVIGRAAGVYNLTLTVSSSTLAHSLFVRVTVRSSSLFALSPVVFYSLVCALGALAVSVVVLGFRRRRRGLFSRPVP